MALSERKKKILKAVVDNYIETANPISSKEIQEKALPDCSSATIRNELSALESMGYLIQPHVSSGRAPSEKAFRLYVDELMETGPLTSTEIEVIDKYFNHRIDSVEDVVKNVAKVLTDITNYTSVVVKSKNDVEMVENIKLVRLSIDNALLIIVTDANVIKDNFIDLPKSIDDKAVLQAEKWLNRMFANKSISQITAEKGNDKIISDDFNVYRELYEKVFEIMVRLSKSQNSDIVTEGAGKILSYPEYTDPSLAKEFLTTIEQKQQLAQLFSSPKDDNIEFSVKMSQEDETIPEGCSVVSAKISLNDKVSGNAGVIGPVRMNYKKVVSVLDHISKLLDNILGDDKNGKK